MQVLRQILTLTSALCMLSAAAQTDISGKVIEDDTEAPLAGASVIIKDSDGKIKKFASTKSDGSFIVSIPASMGCRLNVSMTGFATRSFDLDSIASPLTVRMIPGSIQLREVAVKAERIREQGDTITYSVGSFAQKQDRSIGDVLSRMPGINVGETGKIQYQGEDINRFYIEGSDLLGGKYGIAANGISHEDVGAVEVLENHQPMQVLTGISFSDKAAINLKLKNKAKAVWSIYGNIGGGYSGQPEEATANGELFAMAVMPNTQSIGTVRFNNTGDDLSAITTDFFLSRRDTELDRYISVSLPDLPALDKKRILFNRSVLASTNNLWKLRHGEIKAQADYTFNRVSANASNITTYYLPEGDRIITENRSGTERTHSVTGKFIYELNHKTAFINNTLKTNIDWDDIRLDISGSLSSIQSASLPDYYINNSLKFIKRFNGRHLVTFQSTNEWESLPQTLTAITDNTNATQRIGSHAFRTDESASYSFMFLGMTIGLEGGLKGYFRSMDSDLSGLPELSGMSGYSGSFTNTVATNHLTIYATPRIEYGIRKINISFNAPVSYARYSFRNAIADRNEIYFSPSIRINWKPDNRFNINLRGGLGRTPMDPGLVRPGLIMTDYRTFRLGTDEFNSSTTRNISASFSYKNTRKGVFANAMTIYTMNHRPYTLSQQLFGDCILYSYSTASSSGNMLTASADIGKTLDFMRGSMNINGSFIRNEHNLVSENEHVESISTGWSAGMKINGDPTSWLSIDYRLKLSFSRLSINGSGTSWIITMRNGILINIIPHSKWQWRISGEHYRNEISAGRYKDLFLFDTKLIYRPDRRLEISASLSNLFNRRTYSYTTYNQLSSFESTRFLRGREFLITISLRK